MSLTSFEHIKTTRMIITQELAAHLNLLLDCGAERVRPQDTPLQVKAAHEVYGIAK